MPRTKRWFPVTHQVNEDPEIWELTEKFGDRALRTFLEVMNILDRTENRWKLSGDWLPSLARKVRQQPASVARQLRWMLAKEWLADGSPTTGQPLAEGWPTAGESVTGRSVGAGQPLANHWPAVLSSPNYWEYHRSREPKPHPHENQTGSPPTITTITTLPNSPNPSFFSQQEKQEHPPPPRLHARFIARSAPPVPAGACVRCRVANQEARELHWLEDFKSEEAFEQHLPQQLGPIFVQGMVSWWRKQRRTEA